MYLFYSVSMIPCFVILYNTKSIRLKA